MEESFRNIDAYITVQNDVDIKTLNEITQLLNVKLGWVAGFRTRSDKVSGVLPLPGFCICAGVFKYKESDIEKIKDLLEQKNLSFNIDIRETKTIYECESNGYKRDDIIE